ncbi:MAG: hypothetical protein KAU28_03295 [Phycisphaerae bacterium]|nr:hypothetical protein [Phycisphaerae bacterium]
MTHNKVLLLACLALFAFSASDVVSGQDIKAPPVDKWVTATGTAAGTDLKAKDEAVANALRTAVEEACGVFLTAQSKTRDYKAVYDKIFANTVGYVREYKVVRTWTDEEKTYAKVRVHVSTQKFSKDWAVIAHTVEQENNPRVIVAIVEAVSHTATGPTYEVKEPGIIQSKIEDFFLQKGITLMDREVSEKISKRDVLLAVIKDDEKEIAALGSRFKADVVVTGRASAKFGRTIEIAGQEMYRYTATLNVRAIQTDSARVLAVKSYGPVTSNTLQRAGGEDKTLAKLGKEAAPKLLEAVVEAWRKRANISRTIHLTVSGMDYEAWKTFKTEVEQIQGVQAPRLREITEAVANIDMEYEYTNENLANRLTEMKEVKLKITEITANRIKLKVVE